MRTTAACATTAQQHLQELDALVSDNEEGAAAVFRHTGIF